MGTVYEEVMVLCSEMPQEGEHPCSTGGPEKSKFPERSIRYKAKP